MKIGILTFHYAYNYGATLQSYALQTCLESFGCIVYFIDHRNKQILKDYTAFDIRRFIMRNPVSFIKRIVHECRYYKIRKQRANAFETFISKHLHLCDISEINSNPFDLIIIGSDQVWNYNLTGGFDEFYWGEIEKPEKTKIASYAASMQDSWPSCLDMKIADLLENFNYLSVREKKLAKKLQRLLPSKEIHTVVDPTLLLSREEWDKIAHNPKIASHYLLLYQVDINNAAEHLAKKIAEERNLIVIKLYAQMDKPHSSSVSCSSPADFVGLFKYASFVVCSSFHGTVFSIIYGKSFYSIKVEGKSSRVESLLSTFDLEDRLIETELPIITDIDYEGKPSSISKASLVYLQEIIK